MLSIYPHVASERAKRRQARAWQSPGAFGHAAPLPRDADGMGRAIHKVSQKRSLRFPMLLFLLVVNKPIVYFRLITIVIPKIENRSVVPMSL